MKKIFVNQFVYPLSGVSIFELTNQGQFIQCFKYFNHGKQ